MTKGARWLTALQLTASFACLAVGVAGIEYSFSLAHQNAANSAYATLFFFSTSLLLFPGALLALSSSATKRNVGLLWLGVFSYVAHFLRSPQHIYFSDEFAHFRSALQIFSSGSAFHTNPLVPASGRYPGFEVLIDTVRATTGLSTFAAGSVVVCCAHVAALAGVYALAKACLHSERSAGLAAILYSVAPQFVLFDSLFSYESLGLPMAIWVFAIALRIASGPARSNRTRRPSVLYLGLFALLVLTVTVHHVSSIVAALLVGCVALALLVTQSPSRYRRSAGLGLLCVGGLVAVTLWALVVREPLISYLGASIDNGIRSLAYHFVGIRSITKAPSGTSPTLLATAAPLTNADKPRYEELLAIATPFLYLIACAASLATKPWRRLSGPGYLSCLLLGATYFSTLPLLLSAQGRIVAHRLWAFNLVGLVVIMADGAVQLSRWLLSKRPLNNIFRGFATYVLIMLMLISSFGTAVSTQDAFPLPFSLEAYSIGLTPSSWALARWLQPRLRPNSIVLADFMTAQLLAGVDAANVNTTLAAELLYSDGHIPPSIAGPIRRYVDYIVIDKRLFTLTSSRGYYFYPQEMRIRQPVPHSFFASLKKVRWLRPVYNSKDYLIYVVK